MRVYGNRPVIRPRKDKGLQWCRIVRIKDRNMGESQIIADGIDANNEDEHREKNAEADRLG